MNILFLNRRLNLIGGHEIHVYSQAQILASMGHQLIMATPNGEAFEDWPSALSEHIRYIPFDSIQRMLRGLNKSTADPHGSMGSTNFLEKRVGSPDVAFTRTLDPWLIEQVARHIPTIHFVHSPGDYCPSGTKYFLKKSNPCCIRPGLLRCLAANYRGGCFYQGDGYQWARV